MADYTLLNLRTTSRTWRRRFGMGDGIEAHFARKPLGLEKSGLSYFKLGPDYKLPFGHTHSEQEEIYLVVSGTARLKLDDEEVELAAGRGARSRRASRAAWRPGPRAPR